MTEMYLQDKLLKFMSFNKSEVIFIKFQQYLHLLIDYTWFLFYNRTKLTDERRPAL